MTAMVAAGWLCAAAPRAQAQAAPQRRSTPATPARTQSAGNAGTVAGTVTDATGAIVPGASVTLSNTVSGFSRSVTTDNAGTYTITNVPFNT